MQNILNTVRMILGHPAVKNGLIFGGVALFAALTGMVEVFSERDIVSGILSLGYTLLLVLGLLTGYTISSQTREKPLGIRFIYGALTGLLMGVILALFVLLVRAVNVRDILVNSTPTLLDILTFHLGTPGLIVLIALSAVMGTLGTALENLPLQVRGVLTTGLAWVLVFGLLSDIVKTLLLGLNIPRSIVLSIFSVLGGGITIGAAIVTFVLGTTLKIIWPKAQPAFKQTLQALPPRQRLIVRIITFGLLFALLAILPWLLQRYLSDVMNTVGIYLLMGVGLNIVVGYAGLLDLGYVAFFAIGAYTSAVLTSPASSVGLEWPFWAALPVAMLASGLAGLLLGIPVLRMRGDYLAIVTLGFGEIIRILAISDFLKPFIGGPLGIVRVPKPIIGGFVLVDPQHLYYIVLAGCALAIFVSWRLADSRIGRAWIAMREDEDVAEAMGINLVQNKLAAFAIGASFAGMAGAIFAAKLSSIYPHSFHLLVSINVLSLIIVGGMASIPGVAVGAALLVGLPEMLREFDEFRMMLYGAVLVAMMLFRPEGFWPAARRRRELRTEAEAASTD